MGNSSSERKSQCIIRHPSFILGDLYYEGESLYGRMQVGKEQEYKQWEKLLEVMKGVQDDQFFLLPRNYQIEKHSVCGGSVVVNLQYQNFVYMLSEEIQNRSKNGSHFEEAELWYLLYSLLNSAYHASKLSRRLGDVRPLNIFLNETGQVKIATLFSWPNFRTNLTKTLDRTPTYLSPEELQQCSEGKLLAINNPTLCESFSIGLTMLNAALLTDLHHLYDLQHFHINQPALQKHIHQLINLSFTLQNLSTNQSNKHITHQNKHITTYSPQLKQAIIGLCQLTQKSRVSSIQLYHWLKPYQQQIEKLQTFNIPIPPVSQKYIKQTIKINNHPQNPHNQFIQNPIKIQHKPNTQQLQEKQSPLRKATSFMIPNAREKNSARMPSYLGHDNILYNTMHPKNFTNIHRSPSNRVIRTQMTDKRLIVNNNLKNQRLSNERLLISNNLKKSRLSNEKLLIPNSLKKQRLSNERLLIPRISTNQTIIIPSNKTNFKPIQKNIHYIGRNLSYQSPMKSSIDRREYQFFNARRGSAFQTVTPQNQNIHHKKIEFPKQNTLNEVRRNQFIKPSFYNEIAYKPLDTNELFKKIDEQIIQSKALFP